MGWNIKDKWEKKIIFFLTREDSQFWDQVFAENRIVEKFLPRVSINVQNDALNVIVRYISDIY